MIPRQHMETIEAPKQGDRAMAEQATKGHMEETKSRLLDRFLPRAIRQQSMAYTSDRRTCVNR
jgi:DNA-binding GntR family transcriptional regulator